MEIKQFSNAGIQFLIREEGLIKRPYLDAVKVPTIGVGMTYYPDSGKRVTMQDPPLTEERAISLLRLMVRNYELAVYSVTRDDINHNQFDAMASLCYNIGQPRFKSSTLVKHVNANLFDPEIREDFKDWKKAGGQPILLGRRIREANLYFAKETILTADSDYTIFVKHVQKELGFTGKDVDGIFGKGTKAAVIDFQRSHSLTPDGIVGPTTLSYLNKY